MVLPAQGPVEANPLELRDIRCPEPGPGEVRVGVSCCAVCRTDLHVIEGDLPPHRLPLVPGHQAVGVVDALGEDVTEVSVGDRVGVAWVQGTCGACRFCASGRENLCTDPRFTGWHADGGYAEAMVAPARWAYPIPEEFGDEEAAPLLCAGIIGYRALRLCEAKPGDRLGLYGFGGSAHIVIQLAIHRGMEVYVSSLTEEHRALARELGAAWVGGVDETPPRPLQAAILFAPAGELVPPALRALDRGGTLACAGIHMSRIPGLDYDAELFGERTLRSVTANTRADGLAFLEEAARVPVRAHVVPYALEDANRALRELRAGSFRGAAVLRVGAGS
jgi:propanol-preferring alcohol dehydrogenase